MKTKKKPPQSRSPRIMVRLSPAAEKTLKNLADSDRRPLASYAALVLEDHATARRISG